MHCTEFSYGSCTLPVDADRAGIPTTFAKGVLELETPETAKSPGHVNQVAIKAD